MRISNSLKNNYIPISEKSVSSSYVRALLSNCATLLVPGACLAIENIKSDEYEVQFDTDYLGLGLVEVDYKKSHRIIIQSIKSDSESAMHPELRAGMIVVAIAGQNVETATLSQLASLIKSTKRPFKAVFRDPGLFFSKLDGSKNSIADISTVVRPSTKLSPEEDLQIQRIEVRILFLKFASDIS